MEYPPSFHSMMKQVEQLLHENSRTNPIAHQIFGQVPSKTSFPYRHIRVTAIRGNTEITTGPDGSLHIGLGPSVRPRIGISEISDRARALAQTLVNEYEKSLQPPIASASSFDRAPTISEDWLAASIEHARIGQYARDLELSRP